LSTARTPSLFHSSAVTILSFLCSGTPPPDMCTLSLHDALPICPGGVHCVDVCCGNAVHPVLVGDQGALCSQGQDHKDDPRPTKGADDLVGSVGHAGTRPGAWPQL